MAKRKHQVSVPLDLEFTAAGYCGLASSPSTAVQRVVAG